MLQPFTMALLVCAALVPAAAWPADPADPAAPVPPAIHRSLIDSYRSHPAEPVGSWRDANERVGRQAGAQEHGAHADPSDSRVDPPGGDPHAGHSAPADATSAHDHSARKPGAQAHCAPHRKPAADGAGEGPHTCMRHGDTVAGDGMTHRHDACPMKKEGGHAHR